jgi:hypothetical protein
MIIPNGRGVKMHSEPARVILANARIQDITTAEDWPSRAAPAAFWSWRGHVAAHDWIHAFAGMTRAARL